MGRITDYVYKRYTCVLGRNWDELHFCGGRVNLYPCETMSEQHEVQKLQTEELSDGERSHTAKGSVRSLVLHVVPMWVYRVILLLFIFL